MHPFPRSLVGRPKHYQQALLGILCTRTHRAQHLPALCAGPPREQRFSRRKGKGRPSKQAPRRGLRAGVSLWFGMASRHRRGWQHWGRPEGICGANDRTRTCALRSDINTRTYGQRGARRPRDCSQGQDGQGRRAWTAPGLLPIALSARVRFAGPRARRARSAPPAIGSGEQRGRPAGCSDRTGRVI